MSRFTRGVLAWMAFLAFGQSGTAQQAGVPATEPFFRNLTIHTRYLTRELIEETVDETITINAQPMVQNFSQITWPANEHFFDVTSLEAETVKPDGRRIPVQPDKILVATQPNAPTLYMFQADIRTRTILFQDVQPGDAVHYRVSYRQRKPILEGGMSQIRVAVPAARYKSFVWTIETPADVTLKNTVRQFTLQHSSTSTGANRFSFTLEPQPFRSEETLSTALVDRLPSVRVSTYADKAAIAQEFYNGAAPKAEPTPEIRALAEEVTKGISDRKAQARAIYEHVSTKIRYMALQLGNGGWVPHFANDILKAGYGDCKDHVTIMRALLSAKGIDADYALINVAPMYKSINTPVYAYDHVILYLPELDLYTDPTSTYSAFDALPQSEADKEVLRVGPKGVVEARSPRLDALKNRLTLTTELTVRDDGSPIGKTVAEATGPIARELRGLSADASREGVAEFTRKRLSARRWRGTGDISAPAPTDHIDPFHITSTFDLQNRYFGEGPRPRVIASGTPLLQPFIERIGSYLRENRSQDFPCYANTYRHVFAITLPAEKALAEVPKDTDVKTDLLHYKANYRLEGNVLHIDRTMVANVPSVCTAAMAKTMAPVVRAYRRDIGAPLQFKGEMQKAPPDIDDDN